MANLINKSNIKKTMNKQSKEPPKCNCINKTNYPIRGKCQYKSLVHKVEVHCDHNVTKNNKKKVYIGSTQVIFKKDFITVAFWLVNACNIKSRTNHDMRGNRDIFPGKSIYNRETISRQDHRISEYRIKI